MNGHRKDLELNIEYLDLSRNPSEAYQDVILRMLGMKYAAKQPDIIISDLDQPDNRLLLSIGRLFPDANIILSYSQPPPEESTPLSDRVIGFYNEPNFQTTHLDFIKRVMPGIKHICYISGSAPNEKRDAAQAKEAFEKYGADFDFIYFEGLPLDELLEGVERLPESSAIIFSTYLRDANGNAYTPRNVLELIYASAEAPIFGLTDPYLGYGIVGGRLTSAEQLGSTAAKLALKMIDGKLPAGSPPTKVPATDMYDWRELKRWGISEQQLPENSTIRYREFSFFELYKWHLLLGGCVVLIQSVLIAFLLVTLSRRKTAEKEKGELELALQHAQKMEAIGTLAGGIAHDFNNILAAMIGYTEFALFDVAPGSPLESNLREVMKAGKRAKDLVSQILTFARHSHEAVKPIHVSPIADDALKLIRSTIPASIEIRQQLRAGSPILADPVKIHQVFMNIFVNAVQSMQSGGLLEVSVTDVRKDDIPPERRTHLPQDIYLEIRISDTGSGIPENTIGMIFEPYFTTKEVGAGSGLGLSVVHGIVKAYGGEIFVDSIVSQGTVFTIYFPITREKPKEMPPETSDLPEGNEHILVVDDEPAITDMISQLLSRLGYSVTAKTNSAAALAVFQKNPDAFDLVLTDMTMPAFCGDVLAREIHQIRADIPIILCTGYSKALSNKKPHDISLLLMKPVEPRELATIVRKLLDGKKGTGMNK